MGNRAIISIVVAIVAIYLFFSSIFVINERQQAIVLRFGEITRVVQEPGINFKLPTDIVETVQIIEDRKLRYELEDIRVQVSGGKFYEVDAFIIYQIVDAQKFREAVFGSISTAEQRIDTRLESALRRVYGLRRFEDALSEERTSMMREAAALIRTETEEIGIEVVDVRITRTDLTTEVSQQTFDRMKAERLAEAARLRARVKSWLRLCGRKLTVKLLRLWQLHSGIQTFCVVKVKRSETISSLKHSTKTQSFSNSTVQCSPIGWRLRTMGQPWF